MPSSGFPPGAARRRMAGGASHPAVVTPVRFHKPERSGPLGFTSHCKRASGLWKASPAGSAYNCHYTRLRQNVMLRIRKP